MDPGRVTSSSTSPNTLSFFSVRIYPLPPPSFLPLLILPTCFHKAIVHTTLATMAEPHDKAPPLSSASHLNSASLDEISPGATHIEAVAEHLTTTNRACILFSVLIAAWAYGLDNTLRGSYQAIAANALNANAQLATISVVRAVIGAAAQACSSTLKSDNTCQRGS